MNNLVNNPKKKLTLSYVVALSFVAILSISSQLIIRNVLGDQKEDSRVINISGRQRMLSQKISKLVLQLHTAKNEADYASLLDTFNNIIHLWKSSHLGLLHRDSLLNLGGDNSPVILKYFEELEPHYIVFDQATTQIAESKFGDDISEAVQNILAHEDRFLTIMNTITFQYDKESALRVKEVENLELILLSITIFCLFLEALVIFRPAVNAISRYMTLLQDQNKELEEAHQEVILSNEQKKKVQDDLIKTLRENHNLQLHANQRLEEEILARTEQIREQHHDIVQKSEALEQQNEKITEQNQQLGKLYKKVTQSINYAKKIQQATVLNRDRVISEFDDGFIMNEARDIISGDFYWFHQTPQYKFIILSDCTGHGVPAAFMTVIGNAMLNEIIISNQIHEPDLILKALDQKLYEFLNTKSHEKLRDGMDIAVVRIDEEAKKIRFSGAKRPLVIRNQKNEIEVHKGSLTTIGYIPKKENKSFTKQNIPFQKGDQIYLFSDGYQDQFGGVDDSRFQKSKMINMLKEMEFRDMKMQENVIRYQFFSWKGGKAQTDDVLFIGLQL
ncbi:SpoIIE family protein phosphatase [Sediminitomix flava]|uniref:Serine phosphatase RsbU (Regulator of sigma subunit) n=1 Tax=Sediminitomix flava TaxID=379075 RepID=A0A315ZD56_SEDFL|nr:SpoIIE family protein phosphatase [Sediminitomix flava]PWJ42634.1 serine phosphatase RsbU (regulator of sigma subunit) [Sediminitomix flava]